MQIKWVQWCGGRGRLKDRLGWVQVPKGHRSRGPRMKRDDEEAPESALQETKKRKVPEATPRNTGRRVLTALRKAEASAGRHPPGSLLLAQDPNDLNRQASPLLAMRTGRRQYLMLA